MKEHIAKGIALHIACMFWTGYHGEPYQQFYIAQSEARRVVRERSRKYEIIHSLDRGKRKREAGRQKQNMGDLEQHRKRRLGHR